MYVPVVIRSLFFFLSCKARDNFTRIDGWENCSRYWFVSSRKIGGFGCREALPKEISFVRDAGTHQGTSNRWKEREFTNRIPIVVLPPLWDCCWQRQIASMWQTFLHGLGTCRRRTMNNMIVMMLMMMTMTMAGGGDSNGRNWLDALPGWQRMVGYIPSAGNCKRGNKIKIKTVPGPDSGFVRRQGQRRFPRCSGLECLRVGFLWHSGTHVNRWWWQMVASPASEEGDLL